MIDYSQVVAAYPLDTLIILIFSDRSFKIISIEELKELQRKAA